MKSVDICREPRCGPGSPAPAERTRPSPTGWRTRKGLDSKLPRPSSRDHQAAGPMPLSPEFNSFLQHHQPLASRGQRVGAGLSDVIPMS
ncbi:hypothetical protein EYF80_061519 [Liparis tanakae]|uniref:Uncharacterized protein n=1 Tax=Liparis tanakae TaxID=230148 RepID=A0A4Z2EHP5_9TELE|nr:hypothetical protein EYF80_061519 [Liparis tanakae]